MRRCLSVTAVLAGCLTFVAAPSAAVARPEKVFLLNVGKGQLPPHTGQDDTTIRVGVRAACRPGGSRICAGIAGGKLGPFHVHKLLGSERSEM
ncbi:MAG: hypothetical protein HYS12_14720 [Planctomycetes bacterium]|nr:hypothetical protein [Planctomycetota bacterium]